AARSARVAGARLAAREGGAAEAAQRLAPRGLGRHAATHVFVGSRIDMKPHLFVEDIVPSAEERSTQSAKDSHGALCLVTRSGGACRSPRAAASIWLLLPRAAFRPRASTCRGARARC